MTRMPVSLCRGGKRVTIFANWREASAEGPRRHRKWKGQTHRRMREPPKVKSTLEKGTKRKDRRGETSFFGCWGALGLVRDVLRHGVD
jgi:hypothetical protein